MSDPTLPHTIAPPAVSTSEVQGNDEALRDFLSGDGWIDTSKYADDSVTAAKVEGTLYEEAGANSSGAVRRGKSIIATEESRTNTAYGTLTTPDRVQNIVLPTDGLICVAYQAMWKESVNAAASADIFLGSNQLAHAVANNPAGAQVSPAVSPGGAGAYQPISTFANGLLGGVSSDASVYGGDATTGQSVGVNFLGTNQAVPSASLSAGGPCYIFAAAGTYTVSVQFKASSGSVTAKERKLWVWTMGF